MAARSRAHSTRVPAFDIDLKCAPRDAGRSYADLRAHLVCQARGRRSNIRADDAGAGKAGMPLNLSQKDRKLFLGAGFIFVLLVVAALAFSSADRGRAEYPSSYSSASGGAKAAYLLLSDTGYNVQRWERPLRDLPVDSTNTLTVVLAEPDEAPTREERERLKTFISQGGRVIATGVFAAAFLPESESVPDVLTGMTWKKATSLSPSRITRAAPQTVLAPRAYWQASAAGFPPLGHRDHALA